MLFNTCKKNRPCCILIDELLEEAPYTAVRIEELIAESGYTGKYGLVKNYVKKKKKVLNTKATVRFETMPGKQGQVDWNPLFKDFAGYYGFKPILCRPYRGQTKGKVERTVRYVRENFFMGLNFENVTELNQLAINWCEKVNHKIHSTTQERPYERLNKEHLNPLIREYLLPTKNLRKVEKDCLISFKGNQYSVPPEYILKEVTVHQEKNLLKIYHNQTLIAMHHIPHCICQPKTEPLC